MSVLKLLSKGLLFAPILMLVLFVNYMLDPSGIFRGQPFDRDVVELLMDGNAVSNYESFGEKTRSINEALIMNSPTYDTIVIGSSRSMQITADMVNEQHLFLNMGVMSADYQDFLGTFYICVRENKVPSRVVLSIDPWFFNENEIDFRSNRDLYLAFMIDTLGFDIDYTLPQAPPKWKSLVDPSYFQESIAYYYRDTSTEKKPEAIPASLLYEQATPAKMPDGTILYDKEFRERSQQEIDDAINSKAFSLEAGFRITDYYAPHADLVAQFEAMVAYMQAQGVEVVFYMPPYPPAMYATFVKYQDTYPGFFATEQYIQQYAKENGIALYGSYNPEPLGLDNTDFYDSLHMRATSTKKVFAMPPK